MLDASFSRVVRGNSCKFIDKKLVELVGRVILSDRLAAFILLIGWNWS